MLRQRGKLASCWVGEAQVVAARLAAAWAVVALCGGAGVFVFMAASAADFPGVPSGKWLQQRESFGWQGGVLRAPMPEFVSGAVGVGSDVVAFFAGEVRTRRTTATPVAINAQTTTTTLIAM